ncbi:hypothetical protein K435DRAFT_780474 [Dendrothele bispora CBS 962.96]|uniref:Uncharacterized protein n=1 Tax=Dendrothele bispora (strain CBS 962.96) TaxID=1314807 RepID=A0A4S8LR33_DENBC|nr:hypothetical protein K435DRAFT_780474 [Dendrothele bispora CBS 962.96]
MGLERSRKKKLQFHQIIHSTKGEGQRESRSPEKITQYPGMLGSSWIDIAC